MSCEHAVSSKLSRTSTYPLGCSQSNRETGRKIIASQKCRANNEGRCLGRVRLELERACKDERKWKGSFGSTAKWEMGF